MSAAAKAVDALPNLTPFGKVIGVVDTREKLRVVSEMLTQLGIPDVEVLNGAFGIEALEKDKLAVSNYFFGDMEAVMVQRYLTAAKSGCFVFAAKVESESVEQVAASLKAIGTTDIVHFGDWVITNY